MQTLLGGRLDVDMEQATSGWAPVMDTSGNGGFVELDRVSARQQLKVFYVDVGQGDAMLIEAEDAVIVIDGGPNQGLKHELDRRLAAARAANVAAGLAPAPMMTIDAVIVTHFDQDHFYGLRPILDSPDYRIERLYHNGLPRYGAGAGMDLDMGTIVNHHDGTRSISTDLTGLAAAQALLDSCGLLTANGNVNNFGRFLQSALNAHAAGRLGSMQRLYRRRLDDPPPVVEAGPDVTLEVLAPVTTKPTGEVRLPVFPDPHDVTTANPTPAPSASHTVNGNSVVLKLTYGSRTFLFGGDINQPAQRYLRQRYGQFAPFAVDVNKACHHGSSDFDVAFLRDVNPHATIFSSGDSGNHDHPLPDAMGAAARHSRGELPLIFSTELIRETGTGGILLGHVNARCNGTDLVIAQKKERPTTRRTWHAFKAPYPGPFA